MEISESLTITESKKSLVTSAKDLFLKYGIKSVSMDDIAQLLGMSKKTIYNLVLNKSKLVEAVIKQHISEEQKSIDKIISNSSSALEEMVLISKQTLKTLSQIKPTMAYDLKKYHAKSWNIIQTKHFTYIRSIISANIKRGIKEGLYRKDLSPDIISILYLGLSNVVSNENLQLDPQMKIKDVFDSMINYHLHGIINKKGKEQLSIYLNTLNK